MRSQVPLTIYIVPSGKSLNELADYDASEVGTSITTGKDLLFNKVDGGFSLIIPDKLLLTFDPKFVLNNIIWVFRSNLPSVVPGITLEYLYELEDEDEDDAFDPDIAQAILMLDVEFHKAMEFAEKRHLVHQFRYKRSESITDTAEMYAAIINGDDEDDSDESEEDEDDSWADHVESFEDVMRGYDADDEDERPKKRKRKSKSCSYSASSAVLKASKNPKRDFNRHGVLVVKSEKAIKKDRKIIKDFLEEFIPGNAGWKKKLRRELADRWMHVFAITTKQLKKLEKAHKKSNNEKYKIHVDDNRAVNFARRMFTPHDNWDNPNK